MLTGKCVFDLCDIGKVRRVWNSQTPHAVRVSPLREMSLERFGALVRVVTTDLTGVADVQTMQFIQPVRDWL